MNLQETMEKYDSLTSQQKEEVNDFIEFLSQKNEYVTKQKKMRESGFLKGAIIMRNDFDDPLPGMEEYE